jgi:hypothetical protein
MKGYVWAYDNEIDNFYCITIKTRELIRAETPVINPKFVRYHSTKSIKIQKIYSLGPYYETGEIDEIEGFFDSVDHLYVIKKGDIITNTEIGIFKSIKRVLNEFEFFKEREVNSNTYTGILNYHSVNGDLFEKTVFNNGCKVKSFFYYDNYILKQYLTKNFSVFIDLQNKLKKKIKGIMSFNGIMSGIMSFDGKNPKDLSNNYYCTVYQQQRIITTSKSYRIFDITKGFKNVCKKFKTKNNKKHGLHFNTFINPLLCIYQNDRPISYKIWGLFQLPEFKYLNSRRTFKIK